MINSGIASGTDAVTANNQDLLATQFLGFEGYSSAFINDLDVNKSSKNTYARALKRFFIFTGSRTSMQLCNSDILEYKNHLKDQELSSYTVSTYLVVVRRFFAWLESQKLYPNIALSLKGMKKIRGFRKECLTIDQTKDVISMIDQETLAGKRDFAIINILLRTGLRTIELQRADVSDVIQSGGEAKLYIQGKGRDSKDDFVILTGAALKPLRNYLSCREGIKNNQPLFASLSDRNNGKRMTTRSLSRIAKNALVSAGLNSPKLSAHSLRHTAITTALLAGATLQEVKGMARHDNINTTLIYSHNIDRIANAPERKIDSYLEKHYAI
jgi:integrase/recombinase XerC/integrase/recombinase XerD